MTAGGKLDWLVGGLCVENKVNGDQNAQFLKTCVSSTLQGVGPNKSRLNACHVESSYFSASPENDWKPVCILISFISSLWTVCLFIPPSTHTLFSLVNSNVLSFCNFLIPWEHLNQNVIWLAAKKKTKKDLQGSVITMGLGYYYGGTLAL